MKNVEYLVVLPFVPWEIGVYEGKSSLHCTLIHWFSLPLSLPESALKSEIKSIATEICFANIELVSVEKSLFGPNWDVPVFVLEENKTLVRIHHHLLQYLRANGCSLPREDWIGDHYRPHVSVNSDMTFEIGCRHTIRSLALMKRTIDGTKSIIFQISW